MYNRILNFVEMAASKMNKKPLSWQSRDISLLIIFALAILSLIHFTGNGFTNVIDATDRPNKRYEDFQQYYYPAALVILKHSGPLGGYFYTPAFALFLNSLVARPLPEALTVWRVFQHTWLVLLLLVPAFFLARLAGRKIYAYLYIATLLLSFPVFHNLKWGQVSIMITFCSIFALILYERKRNRAAAFFLALATTVKYYPAFLLAGFLFKKDWKFVGWFSGFILVLGLLLPAAFLGVSATFDFYRLSLAEMSYAIDWVATDTNSQYFPHVIIRLTGLSPDARGPISVLGLLLVLLVLMKIYLRYRNQTEQGSDILLFSGLFLLFPMLINTSWPHYFVWLPFCALLNIAAAPDSKLKALSVTALLMQSIAFFALFPGYREYAFSGILLFANLLVLIHFLLLPADMADSSPIET